MEDAALDELAESLSSLRTEVDWKSKLAHCEQVATQLLSLPPRHESHFDRLLATTINYLLLAQGAVDVSVKLHAEEVLLRVVRAVPSSSRPRLLDVFLKAFRLRFPRSRCLALHWLSVLLPSHIKHASALSFVNQRLALVLETLAGEEEDEVHAALDSALRRVLPALGRYFKCQTLLSIQNQLLPKLLSGSDARARSIASTLCSICSAHRNFLSYVEDKSGGEGSMRHVDEILSDRVIEWLLHFLHVDEDAESYLSSAVCESVAGEQEAQRSLNLTKSQSAGRRRC